MSDAQTRPAVVGEGRPLLAPGGFKGPIDLRIDVSARVEIEGEHEISAWLFVPEKLAHPTTVIFCEHGGSGVTKKYWHMEIEGHPGYSFAEYFASRGVIVVATDDLGVGESSRPADSWLVTSLVTAQANRGVVDHIVERLAAGTLAEGLAPCADPLLIGLSHGRGGMMRLREQAHYRTYDALAIMGFTNNFTSKNIPGDFWGAPLIPIVEQLTAGKRGLQAERELTKLRGNPLVQPSATKRHAMNPLYFFDDVPQAVIEADMKAGVSQDPGPVTMAGMMIGGITADDAAVIDVPVLLGWGERDASTDIRMESTYYRSSPDVTFHYLPRSGHCQNFASGRATHWDRIALWLRDVACMAGKA
jgi:alpha-beta hydrolase superfamily lysophospholipase